MILGPESGTPPQPADAGADDVPEGSCDDACIALEAEVLDRLYGAALEPERLGELLESWEQLMRPQWRQPSRLRRAMLEGTGLLRHVRRLEQVLDRAAPRSRRSVEEAELRQFRRSAAFTLDGAMHVSASNEGARRTLGAVPRTVIAGLNIREEDRQELGRIAGSMLRSCDPDGPSSDRTRMLRVHRQPDDHLVLLRLRLVQPEDARPFVLVLSTEMHWPASADRTLREAFDLTPAEAEVLMALAESRTLNDIAVQRGRSVATVRSQIKAIQAKTEARGQNDLLRLVLGTMEIAPAAPERGTPAPAARGAILSPGRVSPGGQDLGPLTVQRIGRPDGRYVEYLEFGAPDGDPVLYFGSNFGFCRWPAEAERAAASQGLRIIAPIRPGHGGSTPLAPEKDRTTEVGLDVLALLDHLGIPRAAAIVSCEDMIFATRIHRLAPGRLTAVIGASMLLPMTRPEQYERMGRWHRFILGGARFTPQVMPFLVRAGFAMARKIGKPEFIRLVYAGSECDRQMTLNRPVMEALELGSETILSEGFDAARAYAQEISNMCRTDWTQDLERMRGQVPVVNLVGSQDQCMPADTIADYRRDFPWVRFELVEKAGSFVMFQDWPRVLHRVGTLAKGDDPAEDAVQTTPRHRPNGV